MVTIVNQSSHRRAAMNQCPTRKIVPPITSSTLLGTSLLVTRSPRHNRALAGLLRVPTGRVT
jgi:hypothetical protein